MSKNEMNAVKQLIEAKKEKEIILSKLEECKTTIRETEDRHLSEIGKKIVSKRLLQDMYWTLEANWDKVILVGDFGEGKALKELIKLAEPEAVWMVSHLPLVQSFDISLGLIVFKDTPIKISIQTPLDYHEDIDMTVVLDMLKKAHIDFDKIDLGELDKVIEEVEHRVSILENWRKMLSN